MNWRNTGPPGSMGGPQERISDAMRSLTQKAAVSRVCVLSAANRYVAEIAAGIAAVGARRHGVENQNKAVPGRLSLRWSGNELGVRKPAGQPQAGDHRVVRGGLGNVERVAVNDGRKMPVSGGVGHFLRRVEGALFGQRAGPNAGTASGQRDGQREERSVSHYPRSGPHRAGVPLAHNPNMGISRPG